MSDIRTARWVETISSPGMDAGQHTSHWACVDPPAEAWRMDWPHAWSLTVRDSRGTTHTASDWDQCSLHCEHPMTSDQVLTRLTAPAVFAGDAGASGWRAADDVLDGRSVVRMDRESVSGNYRLQHTVWSEPGTRRLVRCEARSIDIETGETTEVRVRERFEYGVDLPDGVFEMPAGRPIVTRDIGATFPNLWATMGPADREGIARAIAVCDAAWRKGSFRAFASVWRFGFQNHLPGRTRWRERFARHAGHWALWETSITRAMEAPGVMAAFAAQSFRGGRQVQGVLCLHGTARAVWADDGREWTGQVTFHVQRRGDGWRIVHWEAPWYEIEENHRKAVEAPAGPA